MHGAEFIQDLAVIMLIAGFVTIAFNYFKQPVVLGYILAGVIIGPHTPPFDLIQDERTIKIVSELGVVFLMFSLGLEFNLKKLSSVGITAFISAMAEITLMTWIGYQIGLYFEWNTMDSLFLGAMLAISSTTIIVKALDELGLKNERFAQLIFGILIVEDILAIGMIALLSGIAMNGSVDAGDVFVTVGKLSLFMIVALILGLLMVPRILAFVAKFKNTEVFLITLLGLCFGFCLLVMQLEYSIALGAFMIGAIMAEARQLHLIERLIAPIRDMFSALFFVGVGLLFNPSVLITYAWPIAVITIAVVLGKIFACGIGTFVAGNDGKTSLRVGMGLSQIGEFSFIIASLGLTLQVTSEFLYPIVVAVSAVTTLLTPYLIKLADPLSQQAASAMPSVISRTGTRYTEWLQSVQLQGDRAMLAKIIMKIVVQVIANCALTAAVFVAGIYLLGAVEQLLGTSFEDERIQKTVVWGGALMCSLPFLIATYRKLKALSLLLAEIITGETSRLAHGWRRVIAETIPLVSIAVILLLIGLLSRSILPPFEMLALLLSAAAVLTALSWRPLVRFHTHLQIALFETLDEEAAEEGNELTTEKTLEKSDQAPDESKNIKVNKDA
ncbi:MAG: cation:proton antiporter [Herminiimonas sp.]|uniref:cation:proton antiporter n=1 Tax=Herminiimonas sp. TaxID=1926289 RepID=UPI00272554EB|nr:cation:proton antiporter [Herminiimonas sp.]MDO9419831.1 cation:proton antiporter [Herminiimonas sp.]